MLSASKTKTETVPSDVALSNDAADQSSHYTGDDSLFVGGSSSEDDADVYQRDTQNVDDDNEVPYDQEALAYEQHRVYDSMFPSLASNESKVKVRVTNSVPLSYTKSSNNSHSDVLQLSPSLVNHSVKVGAVVQKVSRACNVSIDASTAKNSRTTTFVIRGSKDNIARARRLILSKVSVKGSMSVMVPRQIAKFVLGTKWKTLHDIEKVSGVEIRVPDDVKLPQSSDDVTTDVEDAWQIYGDYEGSLLAKNAIEKIVREKTAKVNREFSMRRLYFPFVFGWSLEKLKEITRDSQIFVKLPDNRREFTSDEQEVIVVSGDCDVVAAFIDELNSIVNRLKSDIQSCTLSVPKSTHSYLVGPKFTFVHQLFLETSCYLIVPPRDSDCDSVTLYGPQEHLVQGFQKVLERSKERTSRSLKFPVDSFENIRWAWLQNTESELLHTDSKDDSICIHAYPEKNELVLLGKFDEVEMALQKYQTVFAQISSFHFSPISFPDELLPLLDAPIDENPNSPSIRSYISSKYNLEFFHDFDSHPDAVWLVDKSAKMKPNVFEAARKQVLGRIDSLCIFKSQTLHVLRRFHLTIKGPGGQNLENMKRVVRQKCGTTDILLGIRFPQDSMSDEIIVRGAELAVNLFAGMIEELAQSLEAKTEEVIQEAVLSVESSFFIQHISKNPNWLNDLQDSTGVVFILPKTSDKSNETSFQVQGTQRAIADAKKKLDQKKHKLMNQIVDYVNVDPEYHGHLIGKGGSTLKRLQTMYDVLIIFPSSPLNVSNEADPQRITVKGYKDDVKMAIQEIKDLYKWEQKQSYRFAFAVKKQLVGVILGKAGSRVDAIREQALDMSPKSDVPHTLMIQFVDADKYDSLPVHETENKKPLEMRDEEVAIVLNGSYEACKYAQELINDAIKEFESFQMVQIELPAIWVSWFCMRAKRRYFEILRKITGLEDVHAVDKVVKIDFASRKDVEQALTSMGPFATLTWTLKGTSHYLEELQNLLNTFKTSIKIQPFMALPHEAKKIMGHRGDTLNIILKKYPEIEVQVPNADRVSIDPVIIYGLQDQVEQCYQEIRALMATATSRRASTVASSDTRSRLSVQGLEKDTMEVEPSLQWHILGHNGFCLSKIRELGCRVDLPRHDKSSSTVQIRGPNQAIINEAKAAILSCIARFEKPPKVTKEVRIPTRYHGYIVGRAGAMIQRIRDEVYVETKSTLVTSPLDIDISLKSGRGQCDGDIELITVKAPEENAADVAITKIVAVARLHGFKTPEEIAEQLSREIAVEHDEVVVPIPTLPLPDKTRNIPVHSFDPYVFTDKVMFMECEEGASVGLFKYQ